LGTFFHGVWGLDPFLLFAPKKRVG